MESDWVEILDFVTLLHTVPRGAQFYWCYINIVIHTSFVLHHLIQGLTPWSKWVLVVERNKVILGVGVEKKLKILSHKHLIQKLEHQLRGVISVI